MLYFTIRRDRFFDVPDGVPLPEGTEWVRSLGQPPRTTDLAALARWEVPRDEAIERSRQALEDTPLGQLERGVLELQEALRTPEGRAAVEALATRIKALRRRPAGATDGEDPSG